MQTARVVEGPHLLFTGSNGKKTYGITVESIIYTEEESRRSGYCHRWNINDHSFQRCISILDGLGLSEVEYEGILEEFRRLGV